MLLAIITCITSLVYLARACSQAASYCLYSGCEKISLVCCAQISLWQKCQTFRHAALRDLFYHLIKFTKYKLCSLISNCFLWSQCVIHAFDPEGSAWCFLKTRYENCPFARTSAYIFFLFSQENLLYPESVTLYEGNSFHFIYGCGVVVSLCFEVCVCKGIIMFC